MQISERPTLVLDDGEFVIDMNESEAVITSVDGKSAAGPGAGFLYHRCEPDPLAQAGFERIGQYSLRDGKCARTEIETHKKLSYAWVVGEMGLDTVVTFTLTPTASGTRLSLVQSGFKPEQKQNFGGARYGWKLMGGKLVELLTRTA